MPIPNEWDLQQQQLERKRKFAEALRAQSGDMGPAGQMVGNWYVPTAPTNYLAKALQGALAAYQGGRLDRQEQDTAKKRQDAYNSTTQEVADAMRGRPQETMAPGVMGPPAPAVPGDPKAALAALLRNPDTAGPAMDAQLKQLLAGSKYGTTPQYDQQGRAFVLNDQGQPKYLEGIQARDKMSIGPSGQVYNPYAIQPGQVLHDVNKPFLMAPNGGGVVPNAAVQRYEMSRSAAGAPKTVIPISVSTEKKYGEQFAGQVAQSDIALLDVARKAPQLAQRAMDIKKILSSGKVITGAGADARLSIGKALGLVGATDKETITNTEQVAAMLAQNTMDAIKTSGMGGGTGFSNADRDFLEKAVGGKITLEAQTIKRLADLAHKAAARSADQWNKRVKEIPQSAIQGTGLSAEPIAVPDGGAAPPTPKFLGFE